MGHPMTYAPAQPDAPPNDAYLDAAAALLGLRIAPDWRPEVRMHLAILLANAERVLAFELPDEAEPAEVFTP